MSECCHVKKILLVEIVKATPKLQRGVAIAVKEALKAKLDEEWEKIKGKYTSRFKHPEWASNSAKRSH